MTGRSSCCALAAGCRILGAGYRDLAKTALGRDLPTERRGLHRTLGNSQFGIRVALLQRLVGRKRVKAPGAGRAHTVAVDRLSSSRARVERQSATAYVALGAETRCSLPPHRGTDKVKDIEAGARARRVPGHWPDQRLRPLGQAALNVRVEKLAGRPLNVPDGGPGCGPSFNGCICGRRRVVPALTSQEAVSGVPPGLVVAHNRGSLDAGGGAHAARWHSGNHKRAVDLHQVADLSLGRDIRPRLPRKRDCGLGERPTCGAAAESA